MFALSKAQIFIGSGIVIVQGNKYSRTGLFGFRGIHNRAPWSPRKEASGSDSLARVKVKWGKETYPDIEVNTDEAPLLFKAQLFALTGVQPERQKVMIKGVTLKDTDWDNFKLKDGITVLLMGSKEEDVPKEPVEKTVFVEDMNESELATALDLPAGLTNLGNTCYMNATVQCLKVVPELREALQNFQGGVAAGGSVIPAQSITAALRDLYASMDKGNTVPPIVLLQVFTWHSLGSRRRMTTDANECWTEVVRMLQQKLPAKQNEGSTQEQFKSLIDQYFGGTFDVELKCVEAEDERSLRSIPAYLTVQFVRFYFKEKESINAKILKDVKFPLDFDAYDLCSSELQEKLAPMRAKFKEWEDAQVELAAKDKNQNKGDVKKKRKHLGSNNSGYYTLQAVLTHRGRSSSSGHYVGWVRQSGDNWIKCDDDSISPVTTEDILKLSGGGDWHCAYVLLYGPRLLEITQPNEEEMTTE
ncbi:hypothetical protein NQ318_014157 [Aromia moschata]|uniref:Ubiquitin carboxyl-terminal hydrolase n=1 Tax=Aromia moschata TaxID=1265417 RepID=A0AAV8Y7B7_9CUCU|nr:hypothetical protein NQ318_014157 [Aromia moschata]